MAELAKEFSDDHPLGIMLTLAPSTLPARRRRHSLLHNPPVVIRFGWDVATQSY
jgi:hypothetical protein